MVEVKCEHAEQYREPSPDGKPCVVCANHAEFQWVGREDLIALITKLRYEAIGLKVRGAKPVLWRHHITSPLHATNEALGRQLDAAMARIKDLETELKAAALERFHDDNAELMEKLDD